jgi:hypothetical protein
MRSLVVRIITPSVGVRILPFDTGQASSPGPRAPLVTLEMYDHASKPAFEEGLDRKKPCLQDVPTRMIR